LNAKTIPTFFALVIATAFLSGCQATGPLPGPRSGVVASGVPLRVWHFSSLNIDCSPFGEVIVRIVKTADHGSVTARAGNGYSNYGQANPRYNCNFKPTSGVNAVYSPKPGYTGPDSVSVDVFYPAGVEQQYTSTLIVK
jgi:hypothetical protein